MRGLASAGIGMRVRYGIYLGNFQSMILMMLNRILASGLLVLGAAVTANVVIGKLFSRRRSRMAKTHRYGDLDFTPEQNAMLALVRQQITGNSPAPGEAG